MSLKREHNMPYFQLLGSITVDIAGGVKFRLRHRACFPTFFGDYSPSECVTTPVVSNKLTSIVFFALDYHWVSVATRDARANTPLSKFESRGEICRFRVPPPSPRLGGALRESDEERHGGGDGYGLVMNRARQSRCRSPVPTSSSSDEFPRVFAM